MSEIKLCPFCGADPRGIEVQKEMGDYIVRCLICGAQAGYHSIQEHAIGRWNTRANEHEVKPSEISVTADELVRLFVHPQGKHKQSDESIVRGVFNHLRPYLRKTNSAGTQHSAQPESTGESRGRTDVGRSIEPVSVGDYYTRDQLDAAVDRLANIPQRAEQPVSKPDRSAGDVERVAKAIAETNNWQYWIEPAKAAIAAMQPARPVSVSRVADKAKVDRPTVRYVLEAAGIHVTD